MTIIYHITNKTAWNSATESGAYRADSLEVEGFIHCSTMVQVVAVANAFYRDMADRVLLCIDESLVEPEIKYEAPVHDDEMAASERFPHIYGSLNLDAVIKVVSFQVNDAGYYAFPDEARFD